MTTASKSIFSKASSKVANDGTETCLVFASTLLSNEQSIIADRLKPVIWDKFRAMCGPQYPYPITAIRSNESPLLFFIVQIFEFGFYRASDLEAVGCNNFSNNIPRSPLRVFKCTKYITTDDPT